MRKNTPPTALTAVPANIAQQSQDTPP